MSRLTVRRRTWVLVLALELLVGALIWFSNSPAAAQPSAPTVTAAQHEAATAIAKPDKPDCPKKASTPSMSVWEQLPPIAILIVVIAFVIVRLPRVELGHSPAFRRRRLLNWLPLGLTYSFLYF